MARTKRKKHRRGHEDEAPKGDFEALADHMQQNPWLYTGATLFIIACALSGLLFKMQQSISDQKTAAVFSKALDETTPAAKLEALQPVADGSSKYQASAVYMSAEAAFEAKEFEKAEAGYERLRTEFPDFRFVPDAVEGLGYVHEERKEYADAIARYEEVLSKWPDTFPGRRQPFNIARCQERLDKIEPAIQAYRDQLEMFPGSNLARKAQTALDRLRVSHAELFPDDIVATDESAIDAPAISVDDGLNVVIDTATPAAVELIPEAPAADEETADSETTTTEADSVESDSGDEQPPSK